MELAGIQGLKGTVSVPGDKSISHRCIMFGSIANGTTEIHNFLKGADCLATIRCFQSMGINIEETDHGPRERITRTIRSLKYPRRRKQRHYNPPFVWHSRGTEV